MSKLRVITGGGGGRGGDESQQLDQAQLLGKSKQLRKIRLVMHAWRRGALPPHGAKVLGFAGLAFGAVIGLSWAAGALGLAVQSLIVMGLAALASVSAGVYVNLHDGAPRTHVDHLDQLLASYEPLSKEAYRSLQDKVKERGAMDCDLLQWWLELEHDAIQIAAGWRMPSEGQFLKKKV